MQFNRYANLREECDSVWVCEACDPSEPYDEWLESSHDPYGEIECEACGAMSDDDSDDEADAA